MTRKAIKQITYYDDGSQVEMVPRSVITHKYNLLVRLPHDTERLNFDGGDLRYIPNTENKTAKGHIREDVRSKGKALPEVYRFDPDHSIRLTAPLQHLWYGINPELSVDKWWSLVDWRLAFCNMGAGHSYHDPKANHVAGTHLDKRDPSFDQCRFTGGHVARALLSGNKIYIHTINVNEPLPTVKQLLEDGRLWYWATSISPTGRIQYFTRLGKDGTLKRVRIPLYSRYEVSLGSQEVHYLDPIGQIPLNDVIVHK